MPPALLDRSLGDLARTIPGATALFHRHRLDFCCGGQQRLRDVAQALGLDARTLADELAALQPAQAHDAAADGPSAPALIEHLMARYHARHRAQLPELQRLARRVESVHAARTDCPHGLADHLARMAADLERHMREEEEAVFPLLRTFSPALVQASVAALREEHFAHGEALARLVALAGDLAMPPRACATWQALVLGLRTFREDLMQHIHLENNVLFEGLAPALMDAGEDAGQGAADGAADGAGCGSGPCGCGGR